MTLYEEAQKIFTSGYSGGKIGDMDSPQTKALAEAMENRLKELERKIARKVTTYISHGGPC